MFDAPLLFMTPNFSVPAFNDSGTVALLGQIPNMRLHMQDIRSKYLQLLTREIGQL